MINSVISAVCQTIYNDFGDKYIIYKELVKQNLTAPCFFVECTNETRTQELSNRYFRQHTIAIYYFPESENYRGECNDIFNKLRNSLDYISLDGNLLKAKNLKFEYGDAKKNIGEFSHVILKVFVNYDFFTYENIQVDSVMQDLEILRGCLNE